MSILKPPSTSYITSIVLISLGIVMLGLSFASVPLYKMFCQKTGYGGTPKFAEAMLVKSGKKILTIRFNSDVNPNLPWEFSPLQKEVRVRTGEQGLAFFRVKNTSDREIVGMATYNVTPEKVGAFFNKVSCFCFEEQRLAPHQEVEMPVVFFIDPEIEKTLSKSDLSTVTLSYTFFMIDKPRT